MAEAEQALAEAVLRLEESRGKGEITPFVGYKRVGVDNTVTAGVTIPLPFSNQNQGGIARAAAQRQVTATNLQLVRNRVLAIMVGVGVGLVVDSLEAVGRVVSRAATSDVALFVEHLGLLLGDPRRNPISVHLST